MTKAITVLHYETVITITVDNDVGVISLCDEQQQLIHK